MTSKNNSALVDSMRSHFVQRNEPNYAWQHAVSAVLGLPFLRAVWTMSSVGYQAAGQVPDATGLGNALTNSGTVQFAYGTPLNNYAKFVATSSQFLYRLDGGAGNWADFTGTEAYIPSAQRGLTIGCWSYFDLAAGTAEQVMSKWVTSAARSYELYRAASGAMSMVVRDAGGTNYSITNGSTSATTWYLTWGRFLPSTQLDVGINDEYWTNAVGMPAAIVDSTADFLLGARDTILSPTYCLTGRLSLVFLCAGAVSDTRMKSLYHATRKAFGV